MRITERQLARIIEHLQKTFQDKMSKQKGGGASDYEMPRLMEEYKEELKRHPLANMTLYVYREDGNGKLTGGSIVTNIAKLGSKVIDMLKNNPKARSIAKDMATKAGQAAIKKGAEKVTEMAKKHKIDDSAVFKQGHAAMVDAAEQHLSKKVNALDGGGYVVRGSGMKQTGAGHCGSGMKQTGAGHCGSGMKQAGAGPFSLKRASLLGAVMPDAKTVRKVQHDLFGSGMKQAGSGPGRISYADQGIRNTDGMFAMSSRKHLPANAVPVSQFNHLNFAPQAVAGDAGGY